MTNYLKYLIIKNFLEAVLEIGKIKVLTTE